MKRKFFYITFAFLFTISLLINLYFLLNLSNFLNYNPDNRSFYADKYGYLRFSSDVFDYLVLNKHGSELLELINKTLVIAAIAFAFDFVLVTDPYHYVYALRGDKNLRDGGNSYIRELTLLMNSCYRIVSPKQYSWSTLHCPGLRSDKNSYFKFAGYMASR